MYSIPSGAPLVADTMNVPEWLVSLEFVSQCPDGFDDRLGFLFLDTLVRIGIRETVVCTIDIVDGLGNNDRKSALDSGISKGRRITAREGLSRRMQRVVRGGSHVLQGCIGWLWAVHRTCGKVRDSRDSSPNNAVNEVDQW
jgi:hypothetical protein